MAFQVLVLEMPKVIVLVLKKKREVHKMKVVIGCNKTLDMFSLEVCGMSAQQLDAVRILLKTIIDYAPVFEDADTSGLELKSLVELFPKMKGI